MRINSSNTLWMVGYLFTMALLVYGLFFVKGRIAGKFDSAQAQADWQQWRDEANKQFEGQGPVFRRQPASSRPPLAVLMDEHFATCLIAGLLFGSILFGCTMMMMRGALKSHYQVHQDPLEAR